MAAYVNIRPFDSIGHLRRLVQLRNARCLFQNDDDDYVHLAIRRYESLFHIFT